MIPLSRNSYEIFFSSRHKNVGYKVIFTISFFAIIIEAGAEQNNSLNVKNSVSGTYYEWERIP
jgi:hypothetical protein